MIKIVESLRPINAVLMMAYWQIWYLPATVKLPIAVGVAFYRVEMGIIFINLIGCYMEIERPIAAEKGYWLFRV